MDWRKTFKVAAGVVIAAMLAINIYAAWFHLAPGTARAELVGDDPRVVVWQQRYGGWMDADLDGTLHYDEETRCLAVIDSVGNMVGVAWPKGTRPVVEDGKRGVNVGAYFGLIGGKTIVEGDTIDAGGGGDQSVGETLGNSDCAYIGFFLITSEIESS